MKQTIDNKEYWQIETEILHELEELQCESNSTQEMLYREEVEEMIEFNRLMMNPGWK
jgi:hypothetical protein